MIAAAVTNINHKWGLVIWEDKRYHKWGFAWQGKKVILIKIAVFLVASLAWLSKKSRGYKVIAVAITSIDHKYSLPDRVRKL